MQAITAADISIQPTISNTTIPASRPAAKRAQWIRHLRLPGYVIATLLMSIGGFLNGYDTGSIGGLTEMASFKESIQELSPIMHGFTVSLIMLTGAVPSLVAGQWADRFGRPQVVMAGAFVFAAGAILQGAAGKLGMFLTGRALCGIGQGLWISNIAVYVTEISPSARRGATVSSFQFMATVGMTAGYFTCYSSAKMDSPLEWRIPYLVQVFGAVLLGIGCFFTPMSPRWLIQHGKRDEAILALEKLDYSRTEAEKDFLLPHEGEITVNAVGLREGLTAIFHKGYRQRTILALILLGMVQLCGIDGVLYYAPTLFQQAGLSSSSSSFLASGVSAILITAISIPACLFADKWPRRTAALTGGVLLSGSMFLIGALYASNSVHPWGVARWVVVVSIYVFALTYAATWAVIGKVYASEIQPGKTRAAANCVAQGLNFFTNWLVAMITPVFLSKSSSGAYFLFGGLSSATLIALALYMPETRGHSLESINEVFTSRSPLAGSSLFSGLRRRKVQRPLRDTNTYTNETGIELIEVPGASDRVEASSRSVGDVIRVIRSTV